MVPLKRTPSSVNAPEPQCLWQSQTQVYYSDAFVRHTRLIYVRRLQPWIDFVTLYLGVMPAMVAPLSLDSLSGPFSVHLAAYCAGKSAVSDSRRPLVLVYHMMHLPGGAQYVFDFRLCLKPTASSSPPPQPSTQCVVDLMQWVKTLGKCFEVHFPACSAYS